MKWIHQFYSLIVEAVGFQPLISLKDCGTYKINWLGNLEGTNKICVHLPHWAGSFLKMRDHVGQARCTL